MQRQAASSGSDSDPRYANITDERKRKRMISNRESARRSRMRKQKLMEDLINEASSLQNENGQLKQSIDVNSQRYGEIENANNVLRAQIMELNDRLQSLNSLIQIVDGVNGLDGLDFDTPEMEDPLLKPWQFCCPVQPIMASADMFEY